MSARELVLTALLLGGVACRDAASPPPDAAALAGDWRALLESPGGELPFGLRLRADEAGALTAAAINGVEEVPFTTIRLDGRALLMRFDHYDSEISATIAGTGDELGGAWTKQAGRERPSMIFRASRVTADAPRRFGAPLARAGTGSVSDVSGAWDVVFVDEKETTPARAELEQDGSHLSGTFLTPTGDYRYLDGDYVNGVLRLSCFDGGHAFLFVARARDDGTLAGDFWSRTSSHATWTARRAGAGGAGGREGRDGAAAAMPDPFAMTEPRSPSGNLGFTFHDLEGRAVSLADARFAGKVVLVEIFGSWCPNCNDQAPVLAELYRRYHGRGLEMIGLAYEMMGDPSRDAVYVRRYAERHGVTWPLLLAGTSDKAEASATLPDLSGVLAFPTLIFVGRDGKVAAIHTGFEGPGTGEHFTALRANYARILESLL